MAKKVTYVNNFWKTIDIAEAKVTYWWITRDNYELSGIKLWSVKPKFGGYRWYKQPVNYVCSFCYPNWWRINPELKLEKGQILKIKRTSLPNGFTWEVCG